MNDEAKQKEQESEWVLTPEQIAEMKKSGMYTPCAVRPSDMRTYSRTVLDLSQGDYITATKYTCCIPPVKKQDDLLSVKFKK